MTKATRKEYGKLWKQGLVNNEPSLEKCYLEFKSEIDAELKKEA